MITRDRIRSDVMNADALDRETESDHMAPQQVKGTIDIPEAIIMHHRDLLGHALQVLLLQWGLARVEVRVHPDNGEAPRMSKGASQQRLHLAGHCFPLALTYC